MHLSYRDHTAPEASLPWLLNGLEETHLPLANSLAQSWHMEKSCDHWASQDFPGFVAPQLLQQTHFVQTWEEKWRKRRSAGQCSGSSVRNCLCHSWLELRGWTKVSWVYRPRFFSSWWVWSGGWDPGTPGDSCYGTCRTLAAAATKNGEIKWGFMLRLFNDETLIWLLSQSREKQISTAQFGRADAPIAGEMNRVD